LNWRLNRISKAEDKLLHFINVCSSFCNTSFCLWI
jgi:hypothetical protein